jgi:uncharacterized protein (DUF2252 family)
VGLPCHQQAGGQPHIRDTPPTIFHAEASRAAGDMEMCRETLAKYRETLGDDRRVLFDRYRLVDAAIKVVGIGSVGTLCAVALMMSIADHPFFLQIKQANASVLQLAPPPRKVPGSSQRSPLQATGSRRCLHFGKCACKRRLVP